MAYHYLLLIWLGSVCYAQAEVADEGREGIRV